MQQKNSRVVWPTGLKKTIPRRRILAVLEQADFPMTALDIYSQVEKEGSPIWISTIYRILDTFAEHELVCKTVVMENGMAVYELKQDQHKHYAVCVSCRRIFSMENCPMEEFIPQLTEQGFHVLGHKLEMYGYCAACLQKKQAQS